MTAEPLTDTCSARGEPKLIKCRILEHFAPLPHIRRLALESPELARSCAPGQFVHILCSESGRSYDPLLRRPFSIHFADPDEGKVIVVYEIRGRGTQLLSTKAKGEEVDLIGPLGCGFMIPHEYAGEFLLVGGGIGVAPLYFLLRTLETRFGREQIRFLVGARTAELILCRDQFSKSCSQYMVSTDDGSDGYCGFVTGLMQECMEAHPESPKPIVYACGPMPMLKGVAAVCEGCNLHCQVSVEAKMACGVGACMSCVIKVRDGESGFKYVRSCVEGPVFDAGEILWE